MAEGNSAIPEMREMLHQKLQRLALNVENGRLENLQLEIENTLSMIVQLSTLTDVEVSLNLFESALQILDLQTADTVKTAHAPELVNGTRGRPSYDIPKETLEFCVGNNFKVSDIASLIGVSKRTIERRLHECNLNISQSYSQLPDDELEQQIRSLVCNFPTVGYRTISGLLRSNGVRVQEHRIRRAMISVDPQGVYYRRLFLSTCRVNRRTYSVRGPQALWHIDGYHKLIRWRLVIHGGVDGFSRLPVFLKVSGNNQAQTVLDAFKEAVSQYGLPERVRSDKGLENIRVAEYMLERRGHGNKPFIAGRSVHNQRIERLWRELWNGFTVVYYELFSKMEEEGILDMDNEVHVQLLHLVFIPRLQHHLDQFRDALINRPLRTEGNKSPMQLWISGQVLHPNRTEDREDDLELYGVDCNGPVRIDREAVDVPETLVLPERITQQLQTVLSQHSTCLGLDVFQEALACIRQ